MTKQLLTGVALAALGALTLSACAGNYHDGGRREAAVEVCNDQTCYDARFHRNHYRYAGDRYWYRDNDTWMYWHSERHCWARDRDDWRNWREDRRDWEDREWPADWHYRWEMCS